MSLPSKPSRINFDEISSFQIQRVLKTGTLDSLSPAEREYFSLMELVRGLRARMIMPGGSHVVSKSGIIKLLKSDMYGLSDWQARQVYADSLNFFYSDDSVTSKSWAGFYAERLENLAAAAAATGNLKEARTLYIDAAKLRGCFDDPAPEIPEELLNAGRTIIYTTDAEALGAPSANRAEVEAYIDAIPDIPVISRQRVKEDAGVLKKNMMARLISDRKEFGDDEEK